MTANFRHPQSLNHLFTQSLLPILLLTGCAQAPAYWKSNMLSYGQMFCESGDNYYDAGRVYYQIADYTGDPKWNRCAETAIRAYRDKYLVPNDYRAQGYEIFPHGLLMHFHRTGDERSKTALIGLGSKAAFGRHEPTDWMIGQEMSREVAYNIQAKLLAEQVGYRDRRDVERLVGLALGHYDQWFVSLTAAYVRPFMAALTAEALIMWYETTQDPRVLPALQTGADRMWETMWLSHAGAFKYTDRQTQTGGEEPAPDLNLLIAPLYGWLFMMTGEEKYRQRGDRILEGGVWSTVFTAPKQFNQNYRWSFQYLAWRVQSPRSGSGTPTSGWGSPEPHKTAQGVAIPTDSQPKN